MNTISLKQPWQEALSDLITDPQELLSRLELGPEWLEPAMAAAQLFPLKVTRHFVSRMNKHDINDPLLRQVLPLGVELEKTPGYVADPLHEASVNPLPGLLHKYHGRVLVTLTSACAIHCRYCFRRSFPYSENNPGRQGWEKIFAYIGEDKSIREVILSGGDPLSASDHVIKLFTDQLNLISHVKIVRLHTRLPIVLPDRITDAFINWAMQLKQQLTIVVHINHPQEIDADVHAVLLRLRQTGAQVLNQSVLLKGVNDDADTLIKLSEKLMSSGVLPYYLHVLDKVNGAAHFDIPRERALDIHAEMTKSLPGYLVPKLACEEAGKYSKMILTR